MKRNLMLALTAVLSLGVLGSVGPAWSQGPPIADVDVPEDARYGELGRGEDNKPGLRPCSG